MRYRKGISGTVGDCFLPLSDWWQICCKAMESGKLKRYLSFEKVIDFLYSINLEDMLEKKIFTLLNVSKSEVLYTFLINMLLIKNLFSNNHKCCIFSFLMNKMFCGFYAINRIVHVLWLITQRVVFFSSRLYVLFCSGWTFVSSCHFHSSSKQNFNGLRLCLHCFLS